jgi:hypothetical protein
MIVNAERLERGSRPFRSSVRCKTGHRGWGSADVLRQSLFVGEKATALTAISSQGNVRNVVEHATRGR